jgi:D-alanine-D-alanine ligase
MNIGFIYNLDNDKSPLESDADSPETIRIMISYLKKHHQVFPIEADHNAYEKLKKLKSKIDLVFNYSIGIFGEDRYAHFPAILELLQIPYTGSSPLTQALVLNKSKMYEVLSHNKIKTPSTQIFESAKISNKKYDFPLIVKPNAQGTSAGITPSAIVFNIEDLKKQISFINKTFKQPALAQPFIDGKELTVSLLGNPPKVLPIVEINYQKLPKDRLHFMPYDWNTSEYGDDFAICPAKISKKLKNKVEEVALSCWKVLNIKDYCRIDLRLDKNDNIYVLDVNSPTALAPFEIEIDFFPLSAKKSGLEYGDMLDEIIRVAKKRYETSAS